MIFADLLLCVESVLGTEERTFELGLGAYPSHSHLGLLKGEGEEKSITEHLPPALT